MLLSCEGVWRVCLCLKVCYSHQRIKSCLAKLMLLPCRHGAQREPGRAEALQGGDLGAAQGELCQKDDTAARCERSRFKKTRLKETTSKERRRRRGHRRRGHRHRGHRRRGRTHQRGCRWWACLSTPGPVGVSWE